MHGTVILYFSSNICFSFTFQGNQTKDYFLKGQRQKGTKIEELEWEAAPSKPLVDTQATQISSKQVTACKC